MKRGSPTNKLPITILVNLTTEELLKYAEDNVITELELVLVLLERLIATAKEFSELKDRYYSLQREYGLSW